ncbi:Penicillin-insensitive transglycosylase / Penicillin-sensitive transpeptidase [Rubrivivax sp. A210]|nr:penicillin-binding protein 1A [Rubrivivax sp. A210]CAD5372588.1 Penicillin-insensitive transglycosylase / Penicillin-sensitive transpeptidase [Rubrivivax sp. A210]
MLSRALFWAFGLLLAGVLTLLFVVGVALAVAYPNLPEISSLTDYRPKLPLRVFSADGVQLGEFGEERRNLTPIAQIPQIMKDAVLAAEDSRFYQHGGVDYKGVARAALENLRDARSQGASTITMQVARNFYLSTEKTFTRKIYEILLALKIENLLAKDQILELYMNQIYLGQRANGFASAAEIYFGKKLKDVTVAEAAMLAGLPKAPSAYNPIANPKRATQRQRYIVGRMFENGYITEAQHDEALVQVLRYRTQSDAAVHAEFVAETARQLVFAQYGEETYTRGLNVYLSVNAADQMVAYRALRRGLMDFELRQVYRGPEAYVDLPADATLIDARVAEALAEHPDNDDLRAAVVLEASPRKVVAMLQSGDSVTVVGDGLKPAASGLSDKAGPKKQIRRGAVVRMMRGAKGEWTLTQVPEVEGALVAMEPDTGAIRALVGGFDFNKSKFNHVTQAWRQPGSSFKPFIYSAALEKGFTPATVVNDAPLFFDAAETGSQPWEPKNYDGKFEGPMALQTALAKSKNMVSIRVLRATGTDFAQEWIQHFGFEADKHPAYLTMALGAGSVTPMQMAVAYSVFANGGYRLAPTLITRVTDNKGKVLLGTQVPVLDDSLRTLPARNAFVMDTLLQEVARSGTAARAQATLKRGDLYGKTGTTNDSMDAWFAGFQPKLTAVVWIGYDNPRKLGDRETGGGLALPVWIEFMQHALRNVPVQAIEPPEGVLQSGAYWSFDEFAQGRGVGSLGLDDKLPDPANEEERKSILDLFKR